METKKYTLNYNNESYIDTDKDITVKKIIHLSEAQIIEEAKLNFEFAIHHKYNKWYNTRKLNNLDNIDNAIEYLYTTGYYIKSYKKNKFIF